MKHGMPSRRQLLQIGAAVGGSLLAGQKALALETDPRKLGEPLGPFTERSPFEKSARWQRESKTPETGSSFTPLQDSVGIVTPSALHYERHHSGVPTIDPGKHRLVIHGLVDRPLSISMAEIRRLPSVSRILALECGGNSAGEWGAATGAAGNDVQRSYGLVSGSEWTGVPLSLLLAEAGVQPRASWVIAEGADACRMMRSVPLAKAMENSLLARFVRTDRPGLVRTRADRAGRGDHRRWTDLGQGRVAGAAAAACAHAFPTGVAVRRPGHQHRIARHR